MFNTGGTTTTKVGEVVLEWLDKEMPQGCCSIYKTMNAWGPDLCNIHVRTVTQLLMQEAKLNNYRLTMLLINLAVAYTRKKNSEKI